jgi:hypothetical protein
MEISTVSGFAIHTLHRGPRRGSDADPDYVRFIEWRNEVYVTEPDREQAVVVLYPRDALGYRPLHSFSRKGLTALVEKA